MRVERVQNRALSRGGHYVVNYSCEERESEEEEDNEE
jgi:hypothetical protein